MFLLLHNNAWHFTTSYHLRPDLLFSEATPLLWGVFWILLSLMQSVVSSVKALYTAKCGSCLFQKYLFLHSPSLNNICTVYPLSTLLASLPLFLFVLQYQNLKLAKSASKLLEKQIECKTHNTNKRYFIFISNLFKKEEFRA